MTHASDPDVDPVLMHQLLSHEKPVKVKRWDRNINYIDDLGPTLFSNLVLSYALQQGPCIVREADAAVAAAASATFHSVGHTRSLL